MTKSEIQKLFKSFNDLTCLIIGDVMVDAYIWGKVNRISPEAPVPVFEAKNRENRLGGAANVALNIQALGAKPILCGIIGNDVKGKVFETTLKEQNLSNKGIIKSNNRLTTCKTRIISSSHHMLRVDEEIIEPILKQDAEKLIENIMITLSEYGVLLYSQKNQVHTPAEPRNITDVSGAGDTVISVASLAYCAGIRGKELITLVNLAGGLVCEEVGVVPINKSRLENEYINRAEQ